MRDHVSALTMGKQAFPLRYSWFKSVYQDAIKKNFGYLYMCFNPQTRPELVLKTSIFYHLEIPIIYAEPR